MSWRAILGVAECAEIISAQNSHNTQNYAAKNNNVNIVNCVQTESKLFEVVESLCKDQPITAAEVREELSQEDVDDWCKGRVNADELICLMNSLVQRRIMDQGKVPSHYNKQATCKQCGPIWLWFSGEVLGCPWCWNRAGGLPIPYPPQSNK